MWRNRTTQHCKKATKNKKDSFKVMNITTRSLGPGFDVPQLWALKVRATALSLLNTCCVRAHRSSLKGNAVWDIEGCAPTIDHTKYSTVQRTSFLQHFCHQICYGETPCKGRPTTGLKGLPSWKTPSTGCNVYLKGLGEGIMPSSKSFHLGPLKMAFTSLPLPK